MSSGSLLTISSQCPSGAKVGGNTTAVLQERKTQKNAIGETVPIWQTVQTLTGFLDLSSGSSSYSTFNAKLQESSHVFLCDYAALSVRPEDCRAVIGGEVYDVLLIDDPMGLHAHLEIYLNYVGGQHGTDTH